MKLGRAPFGRRPKGTLLLLAAVCALLAAAPGESQASGPTIKFTTAAQTLTAGVASSPITVALTVTKGPATVTLSSTSPTGRFLSGSTYVTSVTISATQASFAYVDTTAGRATITVAATGANFTGTLTKSQTESITAASASRLVLSPAQATVSPGVQQTYTAISADQYGNRTGSANPTYAIAPDGSCVSAACSAPVPGAHTVTGTYAGLSGTATLTVSSPGGSASRIAISPSSAIAAPGSTKLYTVQAFDASNVSLGDVTAKSTFTISPDGACTGNACGGAQLVAGYHTVTASYGGLTATSSLTVTSNCTTSGPSGGSYTITVCLTPTSGTQVGGQQPVTATVTATGTGASTQKVIFSLDGQYVITDFQAPYTIVLPTWLWADGQHTLQAQATERDNFTSLQPTVSLTFGNSSFTPPVTPSFSPTPGTTPQSGPVVLAAVGDGAGGESSATDVTNLIASWNPNLFLYLGDVYDNGTPTEFMNWYGTRGGPFFGQFSAITDPTIGNHEYPSTPGPGPASAPGYFGYWGNPPDYYSVNTNVGWHVVSLNSNLAGTIGSAQYNWLANDLATNPQSCTLVFFHHPLFNIGVEPVPPRFTDIWPLLAQDGVDVVLNGHDHDYQRWVPLNASGQPDPAGPTEFVVGTGGHSMQSFATTDGRVANDLAGQFGALQMALNPGGASYRFVTTAGQVADSGAISCNPTGTDNQPPTAPSNLVATATAATSVSPGSVNLTWSPSTDNVGVASYEVWRGNQLLVTVGNQTSYTDQSVSPSTTYAYKVRAVDAANNASGYSNPVSVLTPGVAPMFSDSFETHDLSAWSSVTGNMSVECSDAVTGSCAAEAINDGSSSSIQARRVLSSPQSSLYYRIRFEIIQAPASGSFYLGTLRTAATGALLGMYVNPANQKLYLKNYTGNFTSGASYVSTGVTVQPGWHTLQVHVAIAGASSQVETWYDGSPVSAATLAGQSLGTTPVGMIELGENTASGQVYDVRFDDVAADTVQLP